MAAVDIILAFDAEEEVYEPVSGYETNEYSDDYGPVLITNRSIGDLTEQIAVAGDRNSQYVLFQTERYQDNIDLATKKLCIHYESTTDGGCNGNTVATNVKASDEHIQFGWLMPPDATETAGKLKVMPFAYLSENDTYPYVLKELYTEYKVYEGLEF